jgi:predicted nucleic acid-binding protein
LSYLLDTDIIIDWLLEKPDALRLVRGLYGSALFTTLMNVGEAYEGIVYGRDRPRMEDGLRLFLDHAEILPLDAQVRKDR